MARVLCLCLFLWISWWRWWCIRMAKADRTFWWHWRMDIWNIWRSCFLSVSPNWKMNSIRLDTWQSMKSIWVWMDIWWHSNLCCRCPLQFTCCHWTLRLRCLKQGPMSNSCCGIVNRWPCWLAPCRIVYQLYSVSEGPDTFQPSCISPCSGLGRWATPHSGCLAGLWGTLVRHSALLCS